MSALAAYLTAMILRAATFFASMLAWILFGVGHVTFGPTFEALPMIMVFGVEMLYMFVLVLVIHAF